MEWLIRAAALLCGVAVTLLAIQLKVSSEDAQISAVLRRQELLGVDRHPFGLEVKSTSHAIQDGRLAIRGQLQNTGSRIWLDPLLVADLRVGELHVAVCSQEQKFSILPGDALGFRIDCENVRGASVPESLSVNVRVDSAWFDRNRSNENKSKSGGIGPGSS